MKSLQITNALWRSSASTCSALSRPAPFLSLRIASSAPAATLLVSSNSSSSSHYSSTRSFSHTSAQFKKRGKSSAAEEDAEQEEDGEPQGRRGKHNHHKNKFISRASKDTPPKAQREAAAAAAEAHPHGPPIASSSSSSSSGSYSTAAAGAGNPTDPDRPFPDPENPFDLSDLTYTFDKAESQYTSELSKLRSTSTSSGISSHSPELIGSIPVCPDRKNHPNQSYPLKELATVAPLGGRKFSILAFEEASIKPILSAIQNSAEFNQQPQRSEENPLELTITVEPERAEALQKRVKDLCLAWRGKIRDVSHKREQTHKKWKTAGMLVTDDLHRLKEKVRKLQEERMKVIAAKEKEVLAAVAKR